MILLRRLLAIAELHDKMRVATTVGTPCKLAHCIKTSMCHTTVIGDTMQLESVENSVDMSQQKPTLDATTELGGVVEAGFNKISAEGVHFYGMRDGDAGFTSLASETHSPYVNNRPLLTAGKPETRSYKAMFFLGKSEISLQSDVATATATP